ncbi:unnamed protein product [Protopolystoma xenopodis]|uniref:Uncharacterized protein n=1 Tax=Protopolystoma xenopodis TaxID=117903 RepID=A0A3S4ZWV8_9PLAT|nr:unnamed protein product [Protopolystoma xenopodis]
MLKDSETTIGMAEGCFGENSDDNSTERPTPTDDQRTQDLKSPSISVMPIEVQPRPTLFRLASDVTSQPHERLIDRSSVMTSRRSTFAESSAEMAIRKRSCMLSSLMVMDVTTDPLYLPSTKSVMPAWDTSLSGQVNELTTLVGFPSKAEEGAKGKLTDADDEEEKISTQPLDGEPPAPEYDEIEGWEQGNESIG